MNNKTRNGIIVVAIVGLIVIVARKLMNNQKPNIFGGGKSDVKTNEGQGGSGEVIIDSREEDLLLDFDNMAQNLFNYMDGYGTNYKKIFEILESLRNQSDWKSLQKAYGVRKLSSGRGNIFVKDFEGNLKTSLEDELSSSEYKKAKSILSSKGITF